jgi:hypothetical protein
MVPPPVGADVANGNILLSAGKKPLGELSSDFEYQISGRAYF